MRMTPLLHGLTLGLALTGCGSLFSARVAGGPQGVSAQVTADPRLAAAAGLLAAGAAIATSGGAADSHPQPGDGVHTVEVTSGAASQTGTVQTGTVQVGTAQTGGAGGTQTVGVATGGTVEGTQSVGGTQTAGVATGGGAGSAGTGMGTGTGTAAGVGGAVVTLGEVVQVPVVRMGTDDPGSVVAGGTVTLEGVPVVTGLSVLDGDVRVNVLGPAGRGAGAGARWNVGGGTLLVRAQDGRRWRLRVNAGQVVVRTDGPNPSGRRVWATTAGTLHVTVTASGDGTLTLDGDGGARAVVAQTGTPGADHGGLSPRALTALDTLLQTTENGGRDALRLAAAVQTVIRGAEGPQPAFFATPVVGRSIVLVVDVSYSMSEPDPSSVDPSIAPDAKPTKLDVARAELVKVLASLPPDVAVTVVAFSTSMQWLWTQPRTLDDASLGQAIRWVAALHPADETHPLEAIQAAAALHPDQVVLLSDGRPTDSVETDRALLTLAGQMAVHGRLDVVGIGTDDDHDFLAALASQGHGTLRQR